MKMKRTLTLALALALLLTMMAACKEADPPDTTTEPPSTTEPVSTAPATEPPRTAVTAQDIVVDATPVKLTERGEFTAKTHVSDGEMVSPHGYSIGMSFSETQGIWKIPQEMVDFAANRLDSGEVSSLYIYIGNMTYDFVSSSGSGTNYESFILKHFYYGETEFCTVREGLSVLRDIELGDMIADVLASLPGGRKPRQWAIDQLYGEYGKPMSASLEYTIKTGFYDLQIYGETTWIQMIFGSSGKLWYAEVREIN